MAPSPDIVIFWAIAALAAWVQTLTGFALGLILMGATGLLGLMPLPQAAAVTSVLVIINGAQVLWHGWRDLDRRVLALLMIGAMPALAGGYWLLEWMAGQALEALRLTLGAVVAIAAVQLSLRPRHRATLSGAPAFVLAGVAGGLMGGMFATSGPPVIWQLYRQPMPLAAVRVTLVGLFFVTQIFRLGLVAATTGIGAPIVMSAAGAAPAVILGTWAARRFPPPVAALTVRRLALGLLLLSGVAMVATSLPRLF